MARIRIPVTRIIQETFFPLTYLDENGIVQSIPWLRLRLNAVIGRDSLATAFGSRYDPMSDDRPTFTAILDTGAPLTVFPRPVWEQFESQITRLSWNPDEMAGRPPGSRIATASVGGVAFPFFLGQVWV